MSATISRKLASAGAGLLLTVGMAAAEKVRFGPPQDVNLQTRPERSVREVMELRSGVDQLNQGPVVSVPVGVPAAPVASPRAREAEAEQQDWIFRDSRSAAGVRKALGVDSAEPSLPNAPERDSVAVIQEYFTRQRAGAAPSPAALNNGFNLNQAALQGSMPATGNSGATSVRGEANVQGSGALFGESSFRNTLNSENAAVRRYFRELYAAPGSASAEAGSGTREPAVGAPAVAKTTTESAVADVTRSPSFQDLANRAAFINSLTPATTLSPGLTPGPQSVPAEPVKRDAATVNNGNLFERRNGLIEIPGRRF